jgi:hypothetical protein
MLKVTIQHTEDTEIVEAHCLKSEIEQLIEDSQLPEMIKTTDIKVLNPEGEEEL